MGRGKGKSPRKASVASILVPNLAQVAAQLIGSTAPSADDDANSADDVQLVDIAAAPRADVFKFGDSMNAGMREDGRKLSLAMLAEQEASRAANHLPSSETGLVPGGRPYQGSAASGPVLLLLEWWLETC